MIALVILAWLLLIIGVVNVVGGALSRDWRGIIIGAVLIVLAFWVGPTGWPNIGG